MNAKGGTSSSDRLRRVRGHAQGAQTFLSNISEDSTQVGDIILVPLLVKTKQADSKKHVVPMPCIISRIKRKNKHLQCIDSEPQTLKIDVIPLECKREDKCYIIGKILRAWTSKINLGKTRYIPLNGELRTEGHISVGVSVIDSAFEELLKGMVVETTFTTELHRKILASLPHMEYKQKDKLKNKPQYHKCPFENCEKEFSKTTWKPSTRVDHFGRHLALKHNRTDEEGISGEGCGWCGSRKNKCKTFLTKGKWHFRCLKQLATRNITNAKIKDKVVYASKVNRLLCCKFCEKAVWAQNWNTHVDKYHMDKREEAMKLVPSNVLDSIKRDLKNDQTARKRKAKGESTQQKKKRKIKIEEDPEWTENKKKRKRKRQKPIGGAKKKQKVQPEN